ncbi:glycoside hydrolase family 2 TIM barrel-domain containing protein [Arthrobacter sp. GMC3]|uniref:glycoside hydrolase family 2 protein n=1 Tax=Arthrobacter sp. GMC3 TaxID=2058894 RepID=UPI0021583BC0|nr:glycoside hydrolase family 2 TIM barrel-domain containing protein [Arthrobacter sp. GMC3]
MSVARLDPAETLELEAGSALQSMYVSPRGSGRQLEVERWELAFTDADVDADAVAANPGQLDWHQVQTGAMIQWQWYQAGLGPHPYEGRNSNAYLWMQGKLWWFKAVFEVPAAWHGPMARLDLVFDGVDHDAAVWVDGLPAAAHSGAFGGPALDISHLLDAPQGVSHEVIVAVKPGGSGQGKEHGTTGKLVKAETYSRWINNPDLMTAGIWRPVRLVATGDFRLERPMLSSTIRHDGTASIEVEVEVLRADVSPDLAFVPRYGQFPPLDDPRVKDGTQAPSGVLRAELLDADGLVVATRKLDVELLRGHQWVRLSLELDTPRLWWPNGLGDPHLYELRLSLECDGARTDELATVAGVRTFAMKRSPAPRTAEHWLDWQCEVNGEEQFLRGMNWMPLDLLSLVPEKYEHFLRLAKDAGVQLVRVWGGGLMETDGFYELCDSLGLMVWQDFPLNTDYDCAGLDLEVWEQQVVWSVARLQNHPSLVVWCGGNEFNPYLPTNAAAVGIMERTVKDLDPGRPFVRSCSDAGDVHPYLEFDTSWYLKLYRRAPALTEWGGHSIPSMESLGAFMPEAELVRPMDLLDSSEPDRFQESHPTLHHHWAEFNPGRIPRMLDRARIFDDLSLGENTRFVEAVQLGAAEIYETVAADFRASDVDATMVMPWVFSRPWPSVGMQVIDHCGRPTPGYYGIRRGYAPIALAIRSPHEALAGGEVVPLQIAVNRDADEETLRNGALRLRVYDENMVLRRHEDASISRSQFPVFELQVPHGVRYLMVVADLVGEAGHHEARSMRILRVVPASTDPALLAEYRIAPAPTALHNESPLRPLVEQHPTDLGLELLAQPEGSATTGIFTLEAAVTNRGAVPAAFVRWTWADTEWILDAQDDYFWLEPGESRTLTVTFTPAHRTSSFAEARGSGTRPDPSGLGVAAWNAGQRQA